MRGYAVIEPGKVGWMEIDKCIMAGGNCASFNQALMLTKPNGVISNVNFLDGADSFNIPAHLWGLGMADITIRGGMCPGGALRIERLLKLIQADRCHPGKVLNKRFDGIDQLPEAFKIMHEKPRELMKSYVVM